MEPTPAKARAAKLKRTPAGTMHFTVDFDGMTLRVREFWAERKYAYAVKVLVDGFNQTEENALLILAGKKRMADHPEGRKGIDGTLIDDEWNPSDIGNPFYPSPLLGVPYAEAAQARHVAEVENAKLREELDGLLGAHERAEREKRIVDEFVAKERDKEERSQQKQKPDRTFKSDWGWLLPNGNFFACKGEMEHIWLASVLREQLDKIYDGNAERAAERGGWIKIGVHSGSMYAFADERPTQRQLDTLFDYAEAKPSRAKGFKTFLERWDRQER